MGKTKYIDKIKQLFERSPVVSFSSIERIVWETNKSSYSKLLIRNLIQKKLIFRLIRGFYTKHNELSLIVFCFKPAYLGLQSALSFHNLWEQETIPVIITSKNVRTGIRDVGGGNVLIKRIDTKYMFGYDYGREGEFYLPYSDIEKTLIDVIFFKLSLSKDVLTKMKKKTDRKKLNMYLKHYPASFRRKFSKLVFSKD
ncbi:MAG: hypothetical protein AABW88_04415 [Nanoarchaeota archaeon]